MTDSTLKKFWHDSIMYGTFFAPICITFLIVYYFCRDVFVSIGATALVVFVGTVSIAYWYYSKQQVENALVGKHK